ncbi:MAG: AEC family transporter [Alphaproteobacteria bacterium]|nr:AEC family transporter [Alphaproteobacteria bacterium]
MELATQLAAIVAPVFICAGIGLAWARVGAVFDARVVTSLVYNVGAPCLILATFAKVKLSTAALAEMTIAGLLCYAIFATIAWSVLKASRLSIPAYMPSLMFPLTGAMGLPVCYFAFGNEGLALALVYFTLGTIGTFTVGAAIAAGRVTLGFLVKQPAIYAVAFAVIMIETDATMPTWFVNTTTLLGGIVIPAQLIALGVSLAALRVASLRRSVALSLLRLSMGFAVGWAIGEALALSALPRAIVLLQSAMPVAISNYLFAQLYNCEPVEVAGMVLISTTISFFMLPFLLIMVL